MRAILASWASDARAVESMPTLHEPPDVAELVTLGAMIDALRRLDDFPFADGTERLRIRERQQLDAELRRWRGF